MIVFQILSAAVLVGVFSPQPVSAGAILMESHFGFNGQFQLKRWTPLSVTLVNRGRQTSGTLEAVVTSGSEYRQDVYRTTYVTAVELPDHSKKRYSFTIFIDSFTHDLILRLRQGNETVVQESINLRPYYKVHGFAIVADNQIAPHFSGAFPESLEPVSVRPRILPETWFGYDSVQCLIMSAESFDQLNQRQFQALTRWINQGGFLVTTSGLNFGPLSARRTRALLPIRIRGHKQFDQLASLAGFCGQSLSSPGPFLVLHAELEQSQVLVQEESIPIITQKDFGQGKLIFLAFDYRHSSFNDWDGREAFWNKILALHPLTNSHGIALDQQLILRSMLSAMPPEFPGFWRALTFIGIYLLLLRFFVKRLKPSAGKPRPSYLGVGVFIILFSIAGYGFFFRPLDRNSFADNSFSQLDITEAGSATLAKHTIGLYALRDKAYTIELGSSSYPIRPLTDEKSSRKAPRPYVLHTVPSGQRISGFAPRWSDTFYQLRLDPGFSLYGRATMDERQVIITIDNRTPYRLINCLAYIKKRFVPIGDIPANRIHHEHIDLSELKRIEIFAPPEAERSVDKIQTDPGADYFKTLQKNLTADLVSKIDAQYRNNRDLVVLTAWVRAAIVQPRTHHLDRTGEAVSLINCEIPLRITS